MSEKHAAGLGDLMPVSFEDLLLAMFEVSREQLKRLALFILAHALVDRHLIIANAFARIREQGRDPNHLSKEEAEAAVSQAAQSTFAQHLQDASRRGLLPEGCESIATELNRGRNHFLHWVPGRFSLPRYKETDVIADDALTFVSDVLRFLGTVPLDLAARAAVEKPKTGEDL